MGATFCSVTFVPGMSPMSKRRHRRGPSPPTWRITAVLPIFISFSVIFSHSVLAVFLHCTMIRRPRQWVENQKWLPSPI